ncbi:MAG: fabG11 [Conexibacter sp.]|nr:fabG11 [Conexibacter sp.]
MTAAAPDLAGAVAIVTGGGRGIGQAIAQRLAASGAAVAVLDLDAGPATETAQALTAAGHRAVGVPADVGSLASVQAAVEVVLAELGPPTLLVNNAGIHRPGPLHRVEPDGWELVQRVVLQGMFHTMKAVAPWFRDASGGSARRVVNMSSVAGLHGGRLAPAYSAAKAGVVGLTKSMALEWAPYGVTVNAVAPGFIQTRMTAESTTSEGGLPRDLREAAIASIPLGRIGRPEDVAGAVAYFCSPESAFVTGQVLEVHGGLGQIG